MREIRTSGSMRREATASLTLPLASLVSRHLRLAAAMASPYENRFAVMV